MKKLLIALLVVIGACSAKAQAGKISTENMAVLKEFEDTLGLCGFLVITDSLPDERFAACKKMITTLVKALKTENSFHYPFERLKTVSILYPPDSTFRIFTWQLYVDVDDYRYYGAIQMNTKDLKLIPLIDRSAEVDAVENDILQPDKWYGALYYNIRQFDTSVGRKYLLFGFDGFSFFNKRKLIDVLNLQDGKATFGAPVFVEEDSITGATTVRNRIMKEYSAEASVRLNYDEAYNMIIFDHLTAMAGTSGQGMAMVPDGTYEGFIFQNGRWQWVDKIWNQTMDEAPRPEPVLDSGKDVFGKNKKGKGR
ncbi:MAG: hypothetical protein H6577_24850 [Lewinellaceae bacterium]|nr:hypothetical protein [Saprospiraceae bacterium]MCB9341366.1 hypothetical protein [Lewinellaceae bacterium]